MPMFNAALKIILASVLSGWQPDTSSYSYRYQLVSALERHSHGGVFELVQVTKIDAT